MLNIKSSEQCLFQGDESIVAEASSVGILPGHQAPQQLQVDGVLFTRGTDSLDEDSQLVAFTYASATGVKFVIYND